MIRFGTNLTLTAHQRGIIEKHLQENNDDSVLDNEKGEILK